MTSKKLLVVFMATFFLFSNVYGYGITPGSKDFDVIANKTYSDDFCIIDTVKGQTYYVSYEPNPLLFEEFSTEFDSYISSKNGETPHPIDAINEGRTKLNIYTNIIFYS